MKKNILIITLFLSFTGSLHAVGGSVGHAFIKKYKSWKKLEKIEFDKLTAKNVSSLSQSFFKLTGTEQPDLDTVITSLLFKDSASLGSYERKLRASIIYDLQLPTDKFTKKLHRSLVKKLSKFTRTGRFTETFTLPKRSVWDIEKNIHKGLKTKFLTTKKPSKVLTKKNLPKSYLYQYQLSSVDIIDVYWPPEITKMFVKRCEVGYYKDKVDDELIRLSRLLDQFKKPDVEYYLLREVFLEVINHTLIPNLGIVTIKFENDKTLKEAPDASVQLSTMCGTNITYTVSTNVLTPRISHITIEQAMRNKRWAYVYNFADEYGEHKYKIGLKGKVPF